MVVVVFGTILIPTNVVICIQHWVIMMVWTIVLILVERSGHREDGCWNRRCGDDVVGEGRSRGGDRDPVGLLSQGSRQLFQLPAVGWVVRWRISAGHNIEIFDLFKKSPTCSWMWGCLPTGFGTLGKPLRIESFDSEDIEIRRAQVLGGELRDSSQISKYWELESQENIAVCMDG